MDDQRLRARVQALHASVHEAGTLLLCQARAEGMDLPAEVSDRHRSKVLERAAVLEDWLMRPEPDRPRRQLAEHVAIVAPSRRLAEEVAASRRLAPAAWLYAGDRTAVQGRAPGRYLVATSPGIMLTATQREALDYMQATGWTAADSDA